MNFPLFYWNIARIPVATTFLFWWCATLVNLAGRSRHSVSFLNENPRVKSLAGRSRHCVSIFNRNPRLTLRLRHLTSFFGQKSDFRAIEGEEGHTTLGRKRNPMCFQPTKGRSTRAKREKHASDTRGTCEKHARNMRETCEYFRPPITQLRHPSPLLWWDEGITRAVVTKRWRSWRVCIQNEDVHIARNS